MKIFHHSLYVVRSALVHIKHIGSCVAKTLVREQSKSILDPRGAYIGDEKAQKYLSIFQNYIQAEEISELLRNTPVCSFSVRRSKRNDPSTGLYLADFVVVVNAEGDTAEYFWSFSSVEGRYFRHHKDLKRYKKGYADLHQLLYNIGAFYFQAHGKHDSEVVDWIEAEAQKAQRKNSELH